MDREVLLVSGRTAGTQFLPLSPCPVIGLLKVPLCLGDIFNLQVVTPDP